MKNSGINGAQEYVYYDNINALEDGIIYYQLEAIDNNGITKKSKIVSTLKNNAITAHILFTMFPNPTTHTLNLNLNENLTDGNVKIIDMNGKVVYAQSFEGLNTTINTSQLAAGIYSVQVTSNDGIEIQKLSVVR